MNFVQSDLNKVSKYTLRLRKSIFNNDKNKAKEYYDHFKYHIQLGGLDNQDLNKKFEFIDDIINKLTSNTNYKSYDELYKNLSGCTENAKTLKTTNDDLQLQIKELNSKLTESTNNIANIETIKTRDEQIIVLNNNIQSLNLQLEDLKKQNEKLSSDERELDTMKKILDKIYATTKVLNGEIEKKNKTVVDKIEKYQKIIDKIEGQFKMNIDDEDPTQFSKALEELENRLKKSTEHEKNLTNANNQIYGLQKQLSDLNKITNQLSETSKKLLETQQQLSELENSIKKKDLEIDELQKQNNQLKTEKKLNNEQINDIASKLDNKLKELLIKIYGSESLVESIIQGKPFDDKV